jgi:FkbM family methyltransferase
MTQSACKLQTEGIEVDIQIDTNLLFQLVAGKWVQDRGDANLLEKQYLTSESIVVDVGGYTGVWAEKIFNAYAPNLYVLEPVKKFESALRQKFAGAPKVKILNYGLGAPGVFKIGLDADGSSLFQTSGSNELEEITVKSFNDFVAENNLKYIDLIQINIEGSEYALLEDMLNSRFFRKIKKLQVQFHLNIENAQQKRNALRERLQQTHRQLFNYPFVWEAWEALPY